MLIKCRTYIFHRIVCHTLNFAYTVILAGLFDFGVVCVCVSMLGHVHVCFCACILYVCCLFYQCSASNLCTLCFSVINHRHRFLNLITNSDFSLQIGYIFCCQCKLIDHHDWKLCMQYESWISWNWFLRKLQMEVIHSYFEI